MKTTNLIFIFLFFIMLSCNSKTEKSSDAVITEDEIKEIISSKWAEYIDASKNKNAEGILSKWTNDMRLLSDPGGAEDLKGIDEYKKLVDTVLQVVTVISFEINTDEVRFINNSTVLEIGKWSEEFSIEGKEDNVAINGAYMGVWKKQENGDWLIYRFIRNRHDFINQMFEENVQD